MLVVGSAARSRARSLRRYWRFGGFPYRRYMDKRKCIFVHIPKAAGTSVIKALGGSGYPRDHFAWDFYHSADSYRFERYFKFAFVRNPWDRLLSVYRYLARGGNQTTDRDLVSYLSRHFSDFESFVMGFLSVDRIYRHVLLRPQHTFVLDILGRERVDFVGRFENLTEDFSFVQREIGGVPGLSIENASNDRVKYQDLYISQEMIEKVGSLYEKDVSWFEYRFA